MANNDGFPPFDDLKVFLAISSSGGFRAASRRLGLSPSTVSETLSRLEDRLGAPLFVRTTRSVSLTQAGRALADRMEPILSEARAALDDAASSQTQIRGRLKLNVPGAVMVDILPPLIDGFLKLHPEVQVELMVEDRFVDIIAAGCDAGIRYGEELAQDVIAVPIGPARQSASAAASPEYLARRGQPTHPRDLLNHDCIRFRFSSGALTDWEFEKDGEVVKVDVPGRLIVSTAASAAGIDLAMAGQGIAFTFRNWLDPHFHSGALTPVLPDWSPAFDGPRLYFSSRFMPSPLRAFIDFVSTRRR